MGIFSFLDPALKSIFTPLLSLGIFWAVLIISFLISLLIVVIYKYTTDQNLMKSLKTEIKELQNQTKELRDKPAEAMTVQKKAMETNMKYMMQSMKPTLYTLIPIIIIFGWLNMHLAFIPIMPMQDFSVTVNLEDSINGQILVDFPEGIELQGEKVREISDGKIVYSMRGVAGEYLLDFVIAGNKYSRTVLISKSQEYSAPVKTIKDGTVKDIVVNNEKLLVMNLFGWKLGWLGTYIIFSIIFSIGLRKLFKVY